MPDPCGFIERLSWHAGCFAGRIVGPAWRLLRGEIEHYRTAPRWERGAVNVVFAVGAIAVFFAIVRMI